MTGAPGVMLGRGRHHDGDDDFHFADWSESQELRL